MRDPRHEFGALLRVIAFCVLGAICACQHAEQRDQVQWPEHRILPSHYPADLDLSPATPTLMRGSDGHWYVVGQAEQPKKPGRHFLARYSGKWPLSDLPRPPLAKGQVDRILGNGVSLVSLHYSIPDVDIDKLQVTWAEDDDQETVGKGIATIHRLRPEESSDVELLLGEGSGVQPGDIYVILEPLQALRKKRMPPSLGRRVVDICLVHHVEADRSHCRTWKHRGATVEKHLFVGQPMVFLEHTFGLSPRQAVIEIARIEGDEDSKIQTRIQEAFLHFMTDRSTSNIEIVSADFLTDAVDAAFYRNESKSERREAAQLIVGASLVERSGQRHLVVNYTGVGMAAGPGLIAAPPTRGIDLGPVEGLTQIDLHRFASLVYGAALAFRGQTSEAMVHLRYLLDDPALQGRQRWHVRDQFAIQWAALGRVQEALWLAEQDRAAAEETQDGPAYLNALGTIVQLHLMQGQDQRALEASKEYVERLRQPHREGPSLAFALGQHVEVLLAVGLPEAAEETLAEIQELCPDGCGGDLRLLLAGVFWAIPAGQPKLQEQVLRSILLPSPSEGDEKRAISRMFQGISALQNDQLEDALIAFLEAERLYEMTHVTPGVARTKYLMLLTQLARNEWTDSMKLAGESLEYSRKLRDFETASLVYHRVAEYYSGLDLTTAPPMHRQAAEQIMGAAIQSHLALGNYSKSAEGLFRTGLLMLRVEDYEASQALFRQAVLFAIRTARFDLAALSHLSLALIAKQGGDASTFRDELHRATVMGAISQDKSVMETIRNTLSPPEPEPQAPTQLL